VRPASEADVPAIVAMLADDDLGAAREDTSPDAVAAYRDRFLQIDRNPDIDLLVLEHNGAVIGCLQLTFVPCLSHRAALRAQIEAVRIAAGMRGRGMGRLLISQAIDRARARRAGLLELTTHAQRSDAHRLYRSLGFQQSHLGFNLDL